MRAKTASREGVSKSGRPTGLGPPKLKQAKQTAKVHLYSVSEEEAVGGKRNIHVGPFRGT